MKLLPIIITATCLSITSIWFNYMYEQYKVDTKANAIVNKCTNEMVTYGFQYDQAKALCKAKVN